MKKFVFLIFAFLFICALPLLAQNKVITGTVRSSVESEGPIAGVSVIVKGTTTGITTGADGKYSLSVPPNATHPGLLIYWHEKAWKWKLPDVMLLMLLWNLIL